MDKEKENTLDQEKVDESPISKDIKIKGKKVPKLVIISVLILGIVFLSLLLLLFKKQNLSTPSLSNKVLENAKKENTKKAEIIKNYINSQKTKDGYNNLIAHFNEVCGGNNADECPFKDKNVFEINNSWSALGYYGSFKITNNNDDLNLAFSDLDSLTSYCDDNVDECLWVLAQPTLISLDQSTSRYDDFLKKAGEKLLIKSLNAGIMIQSIESRELALLYRKFNDKRYLVEAVKRLAPAKERLEKSFSEKNSDFRQNNSLQACWYTLAAAEIAPLQENGSYYIKEAERIVTDERIKSKIYDNAFAVNIEPCIETYYLLYKQTKDVTYYNEGLRLFIFFERNFHDTPEKKLVWGEGGVVAVNPESKNINQFKDQVNLTDTSYMLYLLYLYSPK